MAGAIEYLDQARLLSARAEFLRQISPIDIDSAVFLGSGGHDRLSLGKEATVKVGFKNLF
jgi:hypothetical protein